MLCSFYEQNQSLSPEDFIEQFLPGNVGLLNALGLERIITIGDNAFDAQKNHEVVHEHGALLITPLKNEDVPIWRTSGEDRKKLKRYFPKRKYHRRSKKETVWSVVKQKLGDAVTSLTFRMQKIELLCRYIAYNIDRIFDKLKITLMGTKNDNQRM